MVVAPRGGPEASNVADQAIARIASTTDRRTEAIAGTSPAAAPIAIDKRKACDPIASNVQFFH
jgi:hypothetical protein